MASVYSALERFLSDATKEAKEHPVAVGVAAAAVTVLLSSAALFNKYVNEELGLRPSAREWLYLASTVSRAHLAHFYRGFRNVTDGEAPLTGRDPVNAAWLQAVLEKKGLLAKGTSVASASVKGLEDNRGLRGVMLAVDVKYTGSAADKSVVVEGQNPAKLVMKTVLYQSPRHRYDMMVANNHREALYYASDIERRHGYSGVRVLHAAASKTTGDSVILMEDLRSSRAGCLGVNIYTGNQIWGIPEEAKRTMAPRAAEDLLRVMVRRAAEIHAPYFNDRETLLSDEFAWLKATDWYRGEGRAAWELAIRATKGSWELGKSRRSMQALPARLRAIIDASFEHTSWEALQKRLNDRSVPVALSHGDFHASNALWQPPADPKAPFSKDGKDGTLFLVDWAEVQMWEPCTDLAQMMISDVKPEVRRACEKRLLELYVRALREAPGSKVPADFTAEQATVLYGRGGPERWIFFISILAAIPLPDVAVQYFSEQFLAFVDDHGHNAPVHVQPKEGKEGGKAVPAYPMGTLGCIGVVFGK